MVTFNYQRQCSHDYRNGHQSQIINQNSLTYADVWCWVVNNGVPRSEIERKLTKFLLDLFKQKCFRSSGQKSNSNHKNRVMVPQSILRLEPIYRPRAF